MNTMVGLEASLHTYVGEEIGELMKNDSKPVAAFDVESDIEEDEDAFALAGDEFDPDELLKSPLLNTSANAFSNSLSENSFGTYEVDEVVASKLPSQAAQNSNSRGSEFAQLRSYDVVKHRPTQLPLYSTPSRAADINPDVSDYGPSKSSSSSNMGPNGFSAMPYANKPVSPPRRMESIKQAAPLPPAPMNFQDSSQFQQQVPQQQANYGMQVEQAQAQQQANYGIQREQQLPSQIQQNMSYGQQLNGTMMNASPLGCPPQPSSSYCSPRQSRSYLIPTQSNSFRAQSPQTSASFSQPMQGSLPQDPGYSSPSRQSSAYGSGNMSSDTSVYCSPSRQSSAYGSVCPQQDMNQLQQMQQYISQVQQMNNMGLSQTVHGDSFRSSSNSMMAGNQSLSQSLHDPSSSNSLRGHSFHASPPSFGTGAYANVSIASDIQANKSYNGESDLNGHSTHSQPSVPLNEAMEKLCESMKRSAMSRSLIKQYSGRGVMRQNSGRMMVKPMQPGNLMRQASASMEDGGSGRGTPPGVVPIRRVSTNAKHHLQHPTRGVYRHDSQQSLNGLNGCSNHGISLQIDGRNIGSL